MVGCSTGTETTAGRTVATNSGFHFTGSITFVYRVDFPDGSYLLASQREPLTYSSNAQGHVTVGGTLLEKGDAL